MGVIRKFRSRAGGRAWAALKKETDAAKRWGPAGCAGSPRVLELSSTRISPRGVKIFFHRGWFPATDTHASWPPRSSLSSVQSLFRPVYYGSARYCLSASVSFTIVINHSRNHWRGDSRSWWEREREFRWEKRTTRCNDRTAILRVSLSAGSFSPFLFFFFFTRAVSSMHVFTVPFFEDFNPAAIQPLIWDSISFEFLFVFNTVRYIRVGAMGNCEQSISPLLLFIKFSNIITFFFLRYLKVKCIWYASNYQLRLN